MFKIKKMVPAILAMLCLFGCNNTTSSKTIEVLPAASDETLQKAVPEKTYEMLYSVYGKNAYNMSAMLNYVGKDIKDIEMKSIDGKTLNYESIKGKKVVFEIVAEWCEYCKTETKEHLDDIMTNNEDTVFVQLFNEGTKEQIDAFYSEIGKEQNPDYVIAADEAKTFADDFGATAYPTFLLFDEKGKLAWSYAGLLETSQYNMIRDVAYGKTKIYETFKKDEIDKNILERTYENVKEDLSEDANKLISKVETDANNLTVLYQNLNLNWLNVSMVDINDDKVQFSDYTGKKIVFEILTTSEDFAGSSTSAKNLKKYKSEDYVFMQLWLMDKTNTDLKSYFKENDIEVFADHVFVLNNTNNVSELSNIQVLNFPTQFFINKDFKIAGATQGAMTKKKFNKAIDAFYGKTPLYEMGKKSTSK